MENGIRLSEPTNRVQAKTRFMYRLGKYICVPSHHTVGVKQTFRSYSHEELNI